MDPKLWGSKLWLVLHILPKAYESGIKNEEKLGLKYFLTGLPFGLPCKLCQEHARGFILQENLDEAIQNASNLFKFFFRMHNHMNRFLGKPELGWQEAKIMYNVNY